MANEVLNVLKIERHRNGICGKPFHAVLFMYNGKKMVASVFDEPRFCSVLCVDDLNVGTLPAWRGDAFEDELRKLIKEHVNKLIGDGIPSWV